MLKILQAKLQQYMNQELKMYKLDFKKEEGPEIKLETSVGSEKKQGDSKKQSASLTTWKPLDLDHNKLEKRWGYQITLPVSWETHIQGKKQQSEPDMEQWTGSKLGEETDKAVYCHPAYLNWMQSTSCEMPGCMNHKLGSRLLGSISTTSDMQMAYLAL